MLPFSGATAASSRAGETRYDSGERIGTFLAVAQLDPPGGWWGHGRRSLAMTFEPVRVDAG